MSNEKPFYILACDGGGVRGLATVRFLLRMEEHLQQKNSNFRIADYFDMFAGTSTGALIIMILGLLKTSMKELSDIFDKNVCGCIMDKSIWDKMLGLIQHKPKYDGKEKTNQIRKILGDRKFKDTNGKYLVIPTYDIENRVAQVFRSDSVNDNLLAWEIADATSAAPGYFPSVKIHNCNFKGKKIDRWFIDGGVIANNPTMCAISEAKRILGKNSNRPIVVLNIGTGFRSVRISGKEARGLWWNRMVITRYNWNCDG